MPKTGSSYLQSLFATNAETFASFGIDYSHPNKGLLEKARRGDITSGNFNPQNAKDQLDRLEKVNCETVLVSNEIMFNVGSIQADQRQRIAKLHPTVIIYVRNPVETHASFQVQGIKRNGQGVVTRDLTWGSNPQSLLNFCQSQSRHLKTWLELHRQGTITLKILPYDRKRDYVADWAEILGIPASAFELPAQKMVNRGLSLAEMKLIYRLRKGRHVRNMSSLSDALCQDFPHIPSELPLPLYPEATKEIMADAWGKLLEEYPEEMQEIVWSSYDPYELGLTAFPGADRIRGPRLRLILRHIAKNFSWRKLPIDPENRR
jgi:hypothetical protein